MGSHEILGLSELADVLDAMFTCMLESLGDDDIHIFIDHALAHDLVTLWTPGTRLCGFKGML